MKILVVEDNPDTADSQALFLRLTGHTVDVAGDGPAALSPPRNDRPTLCCSTSACHGWTAGRSHGACARCRCRSGQPSLPSRAMPARRNASGPTGCGIDFHLTKPVDPHELEELLAQLSAKIPRRL